MDVFGNVPDADNDGVVDALMDEDMDGVPDSVDLDFVGGSDTDGDGIIDVADTDQASGPDSDNDGIVDSSDADADGDGMLDFFTDLGGSATLSALTDTDGNLVPDVFEPDTDLLTGNGVVRSGLQGGGCSVSSNGSNSILWLLLFIASIILWLKRGQQRA